jgi:hypothetical protein
MKKDNSFIEMKNAYKRFVKLAAKVKLESIPLEDGSELVIDDGADLSVGIICYIVDADGNKTVAPDGEYKTADGKTLTISGSLGVVATIGDANADEAKGDETPVDDGSQAPADDTETKAEADGDGSSDGDDTNKDGDDVKQRLDAFESKLNEMYEMMSSFMSANETTMKKVEQSKTELSKVRNEIKKAKNKLENIPAELPINLQKDSDKFKNKVELNRQSNSYNSPNPVEKDTQILEWREKMAKMRS